MKDNFYIVLMAGGSGTRLWPVSRAHLPKQFHAFSSKKSLLQETYDRVKDLAPKNNIYISLVENIAKTSQRQLPEIPQENFIIEPEGKNTAPAIGLAAAKIFQKDPEAIIATVASDHTIEKTAQFQKVIGQAASFVKNNPPYLVTIGIKPTEPHTGYGYIKIGRKITDSPVHEVEKFVEKPDLATAQKYLAAGDYLWNASYFIFQAKAMLDNFKQYQNGIYRGLMTIIRGLGTKDEAKIIEREYRAFPKEPIDTAIAEKIKTIGVICADLGWSDIGSWASLYELLAKNTGETNISQGHHVGVGDKNCLVYAQDKLLATVGLEDIIVIDTPDVTLVCNKNKSQQVKDLIEKLKEQGKHQYL